MTSQTSAHSKVAKYDEALVIITKYTGMVQKKGHHMTKREKEKLVKKTEKFSQVVSQAVQEIMTDMICYLNPTFAIAYGIYQAYNIVKELITRRKEIKIGPFSVMSS